MELSFLLLSLALLGVALAVREYFKLKSILLAQAEVYRQEFFDAADRLLKDERTPEPWRETVLLFSEFIMDENLGRTIARNYTRLMKGEGIAGRPAGERREKNDLLELPEDLWDDARKLFFAFVRASVRTTPFSSYLYLMNTTRQGEVFEAKGQVSAVASAVVDRVTKRQNGDDQLTPGSGFFATNG